MPRPDKVKTSARNKQAAQREEPQLCAAGAENKKGQMKTVEKPKGGDG